MVSVSKMNPPDKPVQSKPPASANAASPRFVPMPLRQPARQASVVQVPQRPQTRSCRQPETVLAKTPARDGDEDGCSAVLSALDGIVDPLLYDTGTQSDTGSGENSEDGAEGACSTADGMCDLFATESTLDLDTLAGGLLPKSGDDGIFEVTLPGGQKMGVAVNMQAALARFHLSVLDDRLAERLRRRKMELQGHLERRMQKNVEITVL